MLNRGFCLRHNEVCHAWRKIAVMQRATAWLLLVSCAAFARADNVDPSEAIRGYLEGLDAGDTPIVAREHLNEPSLLSSLYRSRDNVPIWLAGGPLENEVTNLLSAISESVAHGFSAERYHRSTLESLLEARDESSMLALELLLTDAFLGQALHRGRGAVYPPNLDADWQVPQGEIDAVAFLSEVAGSRRNVGDALATLWPVSEEYAKLVERRAQIAASGDEVTVQISSGRILKPGQTDDRIVLLKQRLMGPGDYSPLYDDDLRREVVAYQRAAGLEPDGIVGDNTLEVLNATRVSWIDRIDANLERWRWLPRDAPDTYVRVNIAAFTLRVIENGATALAMDVIVGRPYRRTPVFAEAIKYMVLNPSWNVPYKIAVEDKLPLLKADAAAQARNGFEAKPQGSDVFVPVDAIDWSGVTRRNFHFLLRQRPGPNNALGQMKFMMPNPYAIYLHDTPSRELFGRQERAFSSGCIRLERPRDLAQWLLSRARNPLAGRVDELLATGETTTIYFDNPVPVWLVYFTAFLSDDGDIVFRRDIYERDKLLVAALRASQQ